MAVVADLTLTAEARGFLGNTPIKSLVGGEWIAAGNGQTMQILDPGSGEPVVEVFVMHEADVDRAVKAAAEAFRSSGWATMAPEERGVYLHRLADFVERDLDAIADILALEGGKIRSQAIDEIKLVSRVIRFYADLALHVEYSTPIPVRNYEARRVRKPYGVCGFIFPWNYPVELLSKGIGPALAAGNTAVVKPAENTPLSTLYVGQLAMEAGIPPGVLNIVAGPGDPTGKALAGHPDLKRMGFTGSVPTGRAIASACAANLVPVKLELGGKGAAVVFEDVDIEETADKLTEYITEHAGQICCTATRWLVHDKIYDDFISAVRAKMQSVRIGHEFDPQARMGPLVNDKQRQRVLSYIERGVAEGAEALLPGGAHVVPKWEGGYYVKPALLAGSLDNVAAQEEIFGPVAYATRFHDEAEAVELANYTRYGLASSVWSQDLQRSNRVAERLSVGNAWINAHNIVPLGVPYAGINNSGMGGGVNSAETLFDYLQNMSVVRPW